jgi:hypothetical protein
MRFYLLALCLLITASCLAADKNNSRLDSDTHFENDFILLPQFYGSRSVGGFQPEPVGPNKLSVMPFFVDRNIYISHARRHVVTPFAEGSAYACIYSQRKRLITEAVVSTSVAQTVDVELSRPALLSSGRRYLLAITADNTTAAGANYLFDSEAMNAIGWLDSAEAANGHCPDRLGTPIGVWPFSAPWTVFYDHLPFSPAAE